MAKDGSRHNRPVSDRLHPYIYTAVAGLTLWFAVSAWVFFSDDEYTGFMIAVVSGFFFVAVAIPLALWRISRKYQESDDPRDAAASFRDWASGDFATWQDRRNAPGAAIEILLPIAAVAFGITAFGIVFHFTAATAVHI